jgi:glycosyltransferase involved in cell wall biosynthesis
MTQTARITSPSETLARTSRYVLITPARNEAAFIELTLKSMTAQTLKPLKWIIVSDGSMDDTDEIVKRYAATNDWIELLRMPERKERNFAGKVHAFNAGYARVKGLDYDFIGSMDADLSFEPDYFEFLLSKFEGQKSLGLVGTPFKENEVAYDYRFVSIEHVSGACQLFRRECFEAVGGYTPVRGGGIDLIAVITARMKGWQTRSFPERILTHHRPQSSAKYNPFMIRFKDGEKDYVLGGHPLWEIFRWIYQMSRRPFIVGGCALLAGYVSAFLRRKPKSVSPELQRFRRAEQMQRLRAKFGFKSPKTSEPANSPINSMGQPLSAPSRALRP